MAPSFHFQQDTSELLEIDALPGFQRVLLEERDDALEQVLSVAHTVRQSVSMVRSNHATTEVRPERLKNLNVTLVLYDGEFRKNLISHLHVSLAADPDVETSFTVHESRDPLRIELHMPIPNIKSLRVPIRVWAFPADCPHVRPILTARESVRVRNGCARSFPHMVRFY